MGSMPAHHMGLFFFRRPVAIPKLSIIIDDIGRSRKTAEMFLALPIPITYAVLPRLRRSEELSIQIHEAGHEVMLHQPMEPFDRSLDPGPGALFVGDQRQRIQSVINNNISAIPFASGVNNHMGSRFTSAGSPMQTALEEVRKKGLYFVDSLTSSRSCAYETAKQFRIQAAKRDVFLDNDRCVQQVLSRLEQLLGLAYLNGRAIGIGHPFPETAVAIERFLHKQRTRPFLCVYASSVLNPSGSGTSADFAFSAGI